MSWVDLKDYNVVEETEEDLKRMKMNKGTLLLKGRKKEMKG